MKAAKERLVAAYEKTQNSKTVTLLSVYSYSCDVCSKCLYWSSSE